ncbi:glycosyltransferase family 25 protein [Halioxenophilus aromaticivorans]|uniref:Glycosyl transferase family 25 domain-containing protein n=1 Tax=Halioxenophilus aromaticivorans TaxID=1306992 RepID=A0AAV3U2S4_9ALTE
MTDLPHLICSIITLNRQVETAGNLFRDIQQQGLPCQWFAGVDGRQEKPALQGREFYNLDRALTRHRQELTVSEIGCYLSHYRAVQQAYEQGYEFACILEDDVVIEDNFATVVRELMAEDLELVRLMALKLRRRKVVKTLASGCLLTRPERGVLGTQAYLFNRRGMQKFLDHAWDMYEAIDHVLDHFFLFDVAQHAVEPHIAYERVRPTNVQKTPCNRCQKPNLWQKLRHHPAKLSFSRKRHAYFRTHKAALFPNDLPNKCPGKSLRLRGKGEAGNVLSNEGETMPSQDSRAENH